MIIFWEEMDGVMPITQGKIYVGSDMNVYVWQDNRGTETNNLICNGM